MATTANATAPIQVTDSPEWGQAADGTPCLWAIFSTPEARWGFLQAEKAKGTYDYQLQWDDRQGYGLELAWYRPTLAKAVAAAAGLLAAPPRPRQLRFTNGRTANHVLVTDSGKVHYAADCRTRPYHVLACTGRAMPGMGAQLAQTTGISCGACSRLVQA